MESSKSHQIVGFRDFHCLIMKFDRIFLSAEDSCKVFCKTKTGVKSRTWIFPDGSACRNDNSDIDDSYYCVNGRCEVSFNQVARFSSSNLLWLKISEIFLHQHNHQLLPYRLVTLPWKPRRRRAGNFSESRPARERPRLQKLRWQSKWKLNR